MNKGMWTFLGLLLFSLAHPAVAEVTFAPRHVMIIRPNVDMIVGSYIFALENHGNTAVKFKGSIMLPLETTDWAPVEGVDPKELRLGDDGGIIIEKEVAPGTNLILMGFQVKALFGKAKLTLAPKEPIQDLSILTPPGALTVTAPGGEFMPNVDFSGHPFDRLAIPSLTPAAKVVVAMTGVPEGRAALWITGSVIGVLLILLAIAGVRWRGVA